MVSEDEMRRLAFSRYLYSLGIEHSHHPQPLSAVAILHFHDAVELFLQLAAEHFNESTNNVQFAQYWGIIEPHLASHRLAEKESMRRLNRLRVNLKHYSNFPAPVSIEGFRANVTTFFEVSTPLIFGIEFDDISMTSLVACADARTSLEHAQRDMTAGDLVGALTQTAIAFARLIDDYEARFSRHFGRSPFDFTESPANLRRNMPVGHPQEVKSELICKLV